ncbi:pectin lyase fold/virulence factor [Pterulicium gracile]|uniref:galacturonan 1,4-alpha-galacturonidase n=1 Tax=Pterulicium gracile TaxID=1884261 RepID=A0A5C3QKA5_9AGAR|nr:pectin lyase fold/virulence factor [Pterula gracilis]
MDMRGLSNKHIGLQGVIKFSSDIPYWTENSFKIPDQNSSTFWYLGGSNILFDGGGTIDGSGQVWWDAFPTNSSLLRPITLVIAESNGVVVQNIRQINGPNWMNLITDSKNVTFTNIDINVKSTSKNPIKNSDGWDIYPSSEIVIKDSVILNGDDYSTNVLISNLDCTGIHFVRFGISVGSLAQYPGVYDIVENVHIDEPHLTAKLNRNIKMADASDGARMKSRAGPNVGSGCVRNITHLNFWNHNVELPVTIDQTRLIDALCYFTPADLCASHPSNLLVDDIFYKNVTGTSSAAVVAQLKCSPGSRCGKIQLDDFLVKPGSGTAQYICQNVVFVLLFTFYVKLGGSSACLFGECAKTG